ncbi:MAG TPA: FeS-binding protein [Porphyromonadaceae bacterium]|nr:ferredoxin family protein [Clostridiaceae bacterium]HAR39689.1 FeS-binding protein [Porphyromonadaceae bacterium]HBB00927.1 FeS-binding protein [Porphyromonadaceae bacterium]HCC17609.1 FeS-binding protein [Porphyromonadaceae bacterium]
MNKGTGWSSRIRTEYIWINPRKCEGCWKCISTCKKQVIGKVDFLWHKHIIIRNPDTCTGCQKCINTCPHEVFNLI